MAELFSNASGKTISHLTLLKRLKKSSAELLRLGYAFHTRRSDGKRIMEISKITWMEGEKVNENRFYQ